MTTNAKERIRRQTLARLFACEGRWWDFVSLFAFPHGLNAGQIAIANAWQEGIRRIVAAIGRRGGKTMIAALMAAYETLRADRHGWVVAPTHDLTGRVWNYYRGILCNNGPIFRTVPEAIGLGFESVRDIRPTKTQSGSIAFGWGSRAEGYTTTGKGVESLVGEPLDWIVWDECAQSINVWEDHLMPNLSDLAGWCLFIGKPWGRNHFEEKFGKGQVESDTWRSFQFTSEVNFLHQPNIKQDFYEAKADYSEELFLQEWCAAFTSFAGQVYKEFQDPRDERGKPTGEGHVRDVEYRPDLPLYLAIDWGVSNPFVCLWIQTTGGDVVRVIDEYYSLDRQGKSLRQSNEQSLDAVIAQHRRRGYPMTPDGSPDVEWAVADRSNPSDIITANGKGIPTQPAVYYLGRGQFKSEIAAGIELARRFFREDRIFLDRERTPHLQRELNRYCYPEEKANREAAEVPRDLDNHGPDALRYLLGNKFGVLYREEYADTEEKPLDPQEVWMRKHLDASDELYDELMEASPYV